ncbi:unnamed protein product [Bursaphelenchus okinawaensis]|uniref:Heat shock protein 70 n=1 Tax=Bursaphelenchus okinawaensis TaxID=465554 RepID=A0A811L5H3_9BILA|nr:unnamed protein product [Bursaphelenchus okinawaensis]CAG9118085.1 unnamed protein product [Bursaphelenchus okinawaensis]
MARVAGFDLGTTYSCVGVYQHGKVKILANGYGNQTLPSCASFTDSDRLAGEAAYEMTTRNYENTVFNAKRLIGRKFSDSTVQSDIKNWPYKVINDNGNPKFQVKYKNEINTYSPEQISAMVLGEMKQLAEDCLGGALTGVVIKVPAYFNDAQRECTRTAAEIAGLNVLRIINEPTAAAIAFGHEQNVSGTKNVLVYDLGGGTFDVSIVTIRDKTYQVRAVGGHTHLGGEDFDIDLMNYMVDEFKAKYNMDMTPNKRSMSRLKRECERAKRQLSFATKVGFDLPSIFDGEDLDTTISRAKFENLIVNRLEDSMKIVENVLRDAKMNKREIDDVILVGGSSRIPMSQQMLSRMFEGKELNKSVHPDEAVAYGAAVQAAILAGDQSADLKKFKIIDVTPMSLGIEVRGGHMSTVIKGNTPIPVKISHCFNTPVDNCTKVSIIVYEGERAMVKDNHLLKAFDLDGLPSVPRGYPVIVTFDINEDGVLKVTAFDSKTGITASVTITDFNMFLSKEEVQKLKDNEEIYKREKHESRQTQDARHTLEKFCFDQLRELKLRDAGDQSENGEIMGKCHRTLEWLDNNPMAKRSEFEDRLREMEDLCACFHSSLVIS